MTIAVTPEQFVSLSSKLESQPGVKVTESTPTTGTVMTSDVTLSYAYDGKASLDVEIVKKSSFKAKLAPASVIESKIRALFAEEIPMDAAAPPEMA